MVTLFAEVVLEESELAVLAPALPVVVSVVSFMTAKGKARVGASWTDRRCLAMMKLDEKKPD